MTGSELSNDWRGVITVGSTGTMRNQPYRPDKYSTVLPSKFELIQGACSKSCISYLFAAKWNKKQYDYFKILAA
jgi:hypothetical protein